MGVLDWNFLKILSLTFKSKFVPLLLSGIISSCFGTSKDVVIVKCQQFIKNIPRHCEFCEKQDT